MPELQPVYVVHAHAVLTFELANRAYFGASISGRDDATLIHRQAHGRNAATYASR